MLLRKESLKKIQACQDLNADFCNSWQHSNQLSWGANWELVIK